ncbi:hypothetical protein BH20ACT2_BH20ACT2_16960 [soil metagenome]
MSRTRAVALGLVFAMVAGGLVAGAPPASADHDAAGCGDVTVVFARGSGQGLNAREAPAFFEKVRARIDTTSVAVTEYELGTTPHDGGQYPAVGVGVDSLQSFRNLLDSDASWTGGLGGEYRASVRSGVTELKSYLGDRAARCPSEVFVVGGYSQGAHVAGDALAEMSATLRAKVAFVAFFGDPRLYLPEGRGPLPPACRGKEYSPWRRGNVSCFTDNGILEGRDPYLPSDLLDRAGSWCDREDPICNGNIFDFVGSAHGDYADDGAEMDEAVREVALALERRLPDHADDIDTTIIILGVGTAGLDIAFVIDTTGSMGPYIDAAKSTADSFAALVTALRGRVALTEYRDAGDAFVAEVRSPLSSDLGAFRAALDPLTPSGGGDTPEALLTALMTTFNTLDWKPGATKAAVVLTDAGYHDPDVATGVTRAEVAARALEIDPVNVYPVVPSFLASFYGPLATDTSGQVIPDTGDTAAALEAAIDAIETRPVALLVTDQVYAAPGDEVTFDASRSYDADSELTSFEWDFDGDGIFDLTSSEPVVDHVYESALTTIAEVRVRSADGGIANAIANVVIDAAGLANQLPSAPASLSYTETLGGDARTVTLDWEPGAGGGAVDGYRILDSDGNVLTATDPAETGTAITDVPLTEVTIEVAATNQFGTAASSITIPAANTAQIATRLIAEAPRLSLSLFGIRVTVSAVLTAADGTPLAAQPLTFTAFGQRCTAVTNLFGRATCSNPLVALLALLGYRVGYAGDDVYEPAEARRGFLG